MGTKNKTNQKHINMKIFGLFVAVTVAKDIAPAETGNTNLGAAAEVVADEVAVADNDEAVADDSGERGKKNKNYGGNNYNGHHDHGNYNHGHQHNHNYNNNGYNGGHHHHNGYQGHHSHQSHHTHTHTTTTSHHPHPQNQYNNNQYNNNDGYNNEGYNNDGYNAQYEAANYNDNYELPCLVPEYGLKCWTCYGRDVAECARTGYTTTCRNSEASCFIEMRKNHGYVSGVHMGCKAPDACWKNKAYNFGKNPECHPGREWGPSVCRQCCQNGNNCMGDGDGYHFDGVLHETKHDWDMDLMNQCEEPYEEETYEEETYEAPYETPYEDDGYGNTNLGY